MKSVRKGFNLQKISDRVKRSIKNERLKDSIGLGSDLKFPNKPEDYVVGSDWWRKGTKILGSPFGKMFIFAGDTNTGKTSVCLDFIRQALDQGAGVLLGESEYKTGPKDLKAAGIDPDQVMLVQSKIAEEYYDLLFKYWDAFKDEHPDVPLLVVCDSLGSLISKRDADLDFEDASKPGGKGQINRRAIGKLLVKMNVDQAALIVVTYTYAQYGVPGNKIAGGKALTLASCLTFETFRRRDLTITRKKKRVKVGTEFIWKLRKEHMNRTDEVNSVLNFQITRDKGLELLDK